MALFDTEKEFVEGGCALIVGTVGPDGAPYASRGWGLQIRPDQRRSVRLLMNLDDPVTHANLSRVGDGGGAIAVTGADVPTLQSFQVKGRVTHVEPAGDDDRARAEHYINHFFHDIEVTDGTPRRLLERLRPADFVTYTIEVDEVFDQTPGPAAGLPVTDDRAS